MLSCLHLQVCMFYNNTVSINKYLTDTPIFQHVILNHNVSYHAKMLLKQTALLSIDCCDQGFDKGTVKALNFAWDLFYKFRGRAVSAKLNTT